MVQKITYTQYGDYYIPDIRLAHTGTQTLGKYGRMRRAFLEQNKPIYYRILKTTYGEAGDPSSVTGLNTDALNVLSGTQHNCFDWAFRLRQVRISDQTAFFLLGDLVEYGNTEEMFSQPKDQRTEDYITGRFG